MCKKIINWWFAIYYFFFVCYNVFVEVYFSLIEVEIHDIYNKIFVLDDR